MEEEKQLLQNLMDKMERTKTVQLQALIGFDGFVDEVLHVVKTRFSKTEYVRYETLKEYGATIAEASGMNQNFEIVTIRKKMGGNGAILADTMATQGVKITYIGACGKETIHPVFQHFCNQVDLISVSNPGHTEAIEFKDGKIINSKLDELDDVSWESIQKIVGTEHLISLVEKADIIGFGNWSLLLHMTDIWKHILKNIAPNISKRKKLFIDLANPSKRTKEDIIEALQCIKDFSNYFDVILGLNKREAILIAQLIDEKNTFDLFKMGKYIRENLQLSILVVHNALESFAVSKEEMALIHTPYCNNPKQVTGAGDNFNAGFILGQLLNVELQEALALGTASAGYYIRYAKNADYNDLWRFLHDWKMDELDRKN